MNRISTKAHGVADYATGALLLAAPRLLRLESARSRALLRAAGGGAPAYSLFPHYELGVRRTLPMKAHLALDAAAGALLASSPWVLGLKSEGTRDWLAPLAFGAGELAAAALTQPVPGDRAADRGGPPEQVVPTQAP